LLAGVDDMPDHNCRDGSAPQSGNPLKQRERLFVSQHSANHLRWHFFRSLGVELVAFLKLALLPGHAGLDARKHEMVGLDDVNLDVAGGVEGKPVHGSNIGTLLANEFRPILEPNLARFRDPNSCTGP
jgi:hypothetical protein